MTGASWANIALAGPSALTQFVDGIPVLHKVCFAERHSSTLGVASGGHIAGALGGLQGCSTANHG